MSVPSETPTPPPGLSAEHLSAIRQAREVNAQNMRYGRMTDESTVDLLDAVLAAYDTLAVRTAWLAACLAETMNS